MAHTYIQNDVSLRRYDGKVLFQVPLFSDSDLVRNFGSVQYNVHRGELQQQLMNLYTSEGGRLITGRRFVRLHQSNGLVTAEFEDNSMITAKLLVGADGAHSAVRRCLFGDTSLRYSGSSCWRGMLQVSPSRLSCASKTNGLGESVSAASNRAMYKTIVHPAGKSASFTCGWTTQNRCFWVLDIKHPQVTLLYLLEFQFYYFVPSHK